MEYHVYILISKVKQGWSYVGSASNLNQRLKDHNSGKTISTKGFRPLELTYAETHNSKAEAYAREKYLKSGIGREEKKRLISFQ